MHIHVKFHVVAVIHKPATFKIFENKFICLMDACDHNLPAPEILDTKII